MGDQRSEVQNALGVMLTNGGGFLLFRNIEFVIIPKFQFNCGRVSAGHASSRTRDCIGGGYAKYQ